MKGNAKQDEEDDYTLGNLLHTLHICERALPTNSHPIHYERIEYIKRILQDRERNNDRGTQPTDTSQKTTR
jgi:hypothetical protein